MRLFQQFVDALLHGFVVVPRSGQTVAAVVSVAPQAPDDLTGKLVYGLAGLGGHQLKVGGFDGAADGVPAVLRSITTLAPFTCLTYQFFALTQPGIVLPL